MRERESWTPPQLAKKWGVAAEKVILWIEMGELAALNLAATLGGRPRYRVTAEAKADFERRRAVVKSSKPARVRRPAFREYV